LSDIIVKLHLVTFVCLEITTCSRVRRSTSWTYPPTCKPIKKEWKK